MKKLMLLSIGLALFSLAVVATETCSGKNYIPQTNEDKAAAPAPKQPNVDECHDGSFFC